MDRKESIRSAYRMTGGNSFYDGMITCSTLSGKAVCRLVWAMNKAENDDYLEKALSGIPENRIIGSGTILDTARLRARISEYFRISQSNVHAYVFGEHGDSAFIPWSVANVSNVPIDECQKVLGHSPLENPAMDYDEIEQYVKKSGGRVIARKGATFYAVSISVCHIIKCLLNGMDTTMTVSTMMHGEYGIDDVCLSTLNLLGNKQVNGKVLVPLTDDEVARLRASADTLKGIIKGLTI